MAGIVALSINETRLERVDAPAFLFVAFTSVGAFHWLRRWTAVRWLAASLPFWALGNASDGMMAGALGLTMAWLVTGALLPTLPARRRRFGGAPLPQLASGPLVPVESRTFPCGRRSRLLGWAAAALAVTAAALAAAAAFGADAAVSGGLAMGAVIVAATFAFGNWFADRMRLRSDEIGLHSRVLFGERTLPWREVADVHLRYVFLGMGGGMRIVYFVVRSPTREFSFTGSMAGADDLRRIIEQATGLTFPEPEFTSTL